MTRFIYRGKKKEKRRPLPAWNIVSRVMLKRLKQTELITGRRKSDQCALASNEANRRRSEEEKRNNVGCFVRKHVWKSLNIQWQSRKISYYYFIFDSIENWKVKKIKIISFRPSFLNTIFHLSIVTWSIVKIKSIDKS